MKYSFINDIPIMIGFISCDLEYIYVNQSLQDWLGDSSVIGKKLSECGNSKLYSMLMPHFEEVLTGREQKLELITPPDEHRSSQILSIQMIPKKNILDKECKFCIMIQDITKFKTDASLAIEKERKLSTILNNLSHAVILHDSKGRVIEFNPRALAILDMTSDQLLGRIKIDPNYTILDENLKLFPENQLPCVTTLETGLPVINLIMAFAKDDKSLTWVRVNTTPVFQGQSLKPHQVIVTLEDITKKRQLECKLKNKSVWTEAILNASNKLIISTLTDGTIKTFNKKAEELLGYEASELIDKETVLLFHDPSEIRQRAQDLTQELKQNIQPNFSVFTVKTLESKSYTQNWFYISKEQKKLKVQLTITPIFDEKKICIGYLAIAEEDLIKYP